MVSSRVVHRKDSLKNVEFEERVLRVSRVSKVVKGGRIFSFSTLVVIGNRGGYFGVGLGKALEVGEARRKAINAAKNNLYFVPLTASFGLLHEVFSSFGATKILFRPAKVGTGIVAGGAVRAILECMGIRDAVAKIIGSTNVHNVTKASIAALMCIKSKDKIKLFS